MYVAAMGSTQHDLVIFDCDGVLVDSERLTVTVESRLLTSMGWPITVDEVVEQFMGRSDKAVLADVAAKLGDDLAERYDTQLTSEVRQAFRDELTEIEGVRDLIEAVHAAGIATCIASSGSYDKMDLTLGITRLQPLFEGRIFSASEVEHGKPAPDLFLYAAKQMGVNPANCAVIEDSPNGVRAAVAAGMTCYGYAGGLAAAGTLQAAGAMPFGQMRELHQYLVGTPPTP